MENEEDCYQCVTKVLQQNSGPCIGLRVLCFGAADRLIGGVAQLQPLRMQPAEHLHEDLGRG